MLSALGFAQSDKEFAKVFGYETNYEVALKKAKKAKKDILMIQVAHYCPWCKKLESKALSSEKINTYIHKNYIPLIVDREDGGLDKRFDTSIVPVTYIIDYKDDTKFKKVPGYQTKSDFFYFIQKH
jgi:thioredoxin-related protein